ncbi:MAG: HEPN domain-containing protein [Candidatus Nanoarchaeia archaeon]|nr:HEPN domain-containing protein [Candidatus Nanoarchaeia archaeon]
MKTYDVDKYLNDSELVDELIKDFKKKKIITNISSNADVKGHILKSSHNLEFVNDIDKNKFIDWAIIGCYYAAYHSALALIQSKGFTSKNHLATLLVLINEFYQKGLNEEDIESLMNVLSYEDILFYVETKNKREDASYSSRIIFDRKDLESLKLKTILFVSKVKKILNN